MLLMFGESEYIGILESYMNIMEIEDSIPCETCVSNETQTKCNCISADVLFQIHVYRSFVLFLTTKHAPNIF
jgi:hypothetical protein